MPKRKISKQQKFRIKKLQDSRLQRAKKSVVRAASSKLTPVTQLDSEREGLLIAHYGSFVDVETKRRKIYRCHLRQNIDAMVAGDRVIFKPGKKATGVVVALCPRTSLLARPNDRNGLKPIAANIDQIIIVIAPEPIPTLELIDSYFVTAEVSNISALLLLNKTDLLNKQSRLTMHELLNRYGNLGYTVLTSSTLKAQTMRQIKARLKDHCSIFVGQSGVGKTSLINTLIPGLSVKIKELTKVGKLGAHTTTTSRLYHIPLSGDIIDSPGIREFRLWHLPPEQIAQGFVEFRDYLGQCQFRNCRHTAEPNCAVLQAVTDGKISKQRLASYYAILASQC